MFFFIFSAVVFFAPAAKAATWKPTAPDGYALITWAKAPGVATFFKAPGGNGSIDFLTRIYLPQNQIGYIVSSSAPLDWGKVDTFVDAGAATGSFRNLAFTRLVAESAKKAAPVARFVWNGPFFNVTNPISDLSMALKFTIGTTTFVTSGSRPDADMARQRRMLIVNNQTGRAVIGDFDSAVFTSSTAGDQALEGFAPSAGNGTATARLFLGVSADGKELVVYCSRQATAQDASEALVAAGIPLERQLEADGGGSAACGYNLPGQFFVEPTRMLPVLMGATTILKRGVVKGDNINVRGGPSTKNSIVAKLRKGAAVRAYEEKKGWFRIGDKQWVLGSLIK